MNIAVESPASPTNLSPAPSPRNTRLFRNLKSDHPKRLLACVPNLSGSLGISRVYTGSCDALRRRGWQVDYLSPADLGLSVGILEETYRQALRERLQAVAGGYDFVEYDYSTLPFPRGDFPATPVFVACSVLLDHHLRDITLPSLLKGPRRLASLLRGKLPGRRPGWNLPDHIARCDATMRSADLVSVAGPRDLAKLVSLGMPREKVAVLPYGLDISDFERLAAVPAHDTPPPRAVFLGTFDARKGGAELPRIFTALRKRHPGFRLRLLGTAGLYPTAGEVAAFFPRALRPALEIFPRFERADLPALLSDCTLGIFPSHLESFGFSVLEKMAAGLPVLAYDVPGPGDLLPREWLVPRGDWAALGGLAEQFLSHPERLPAARLLARETASRWTWDKAGKLTEEAFLQAQKHHVTA